MDTKKSYLKVYEVIPLILKNSRQVHNFEVPRWSIYRDSTVPEWKGEKRAKLSKTFSPGEKLSSQHTRIFWEKYETN